MTQRLQTFYVQKIIPELKKKFNYKNTLAVPRLEKIVINRGLGLGKANQTDLKKDTSKTNKLQSSTSNNSLSQSQGNYLSSWKQELSVLSGQMGVVSVSKKDIAGFKIRRKNVVGLYVTLRGNRMYGFLDRLINLALPRIRDFQGLSRNSLDGHGNYSLGLSEQLMFPEILYDKILKGGIRGMDISIVTSSKTDDEAYALLKEFGMPFKETRQNLKK